MKRDQRLTLIINNVILTAGYILTGFLGLKVAAVDGFATPIWAPTGISLAAALIWGIGIWPAVFIGATAVNMYAGASILTGMAASCGSVFEVFFAVYFFKRFGFRNQLDRLKDVIVLAIFGAICSAFLCANIGISALVWGGAIPAAHYHEAMLTWWLGDGVSDLIIASPLLVFATSNRVFRKPHSWKKLEALGLAALLVFGGILIFTNEIGGQLIVMPRTYMLFPVLLWAAVRFGQRGVTLSNLLVASFAAWGTLNGVGVFARPGIHKGLFFLQLFLFVMALTDMALSAIDAERRKAESSLKDAQAELEAKVKARTEAVVFANEALKEGEETLRKSEAQLVEAQRIAHIGSWQWNLTNDVCTWSGEIASIYGFEEGRTTGKFPDFIERAHPEDQETVLQTVKSIRRFPGEFSIEHRIVTSSGNIRTVQIQGRRMEKPAGDPEVIGTTQDVTNWKIVTESLRKAHEELENRVRQRTEELAGVNQILQTEVAERKNSEQMQRFLAETSSALVSSLDTPTALSTAVGQVRKSFADWCIVSLLNEEGALYEAVFGFPESEEARLAPGTKLRAELSEAVSALARSAIDSGKSRVDLGAEGGLALPTAAEQNLSFNSYVCVPLSAAEKTYGAITVLSNSPRRRFTRTDLNVAEEVAQRVALALDNARHYKDAQHAIRLRDEFLSIASHELKTPLTSLSLQLQLLQRAIKKRFGSATSENAAMGPEDPVFQMLIGSEKQGKRMANLVDELLDLTRIQAGKLVLQKGNHDLVELVGEVVNRFKSAISESRVPIAFRFSSRPVGNWDRSRIEQVVTNLVSNAIKYGNERPIEVAVEAEGDLAKIGVKDQGIGISPSLKAKIFEKFERGAPGSSVSGLGLGLYISRQIVDAHGGKISVESQPSQGSVFTVSLPTARSHSRQAAF